MVILMLVLGLFFLTAGAESLVRGSSRLAMATGISPPVGLLPDESGRQSLLRFLSISPMLRCDSSGCRSFLSTVIWYVLRRPTLVTSR